MITDQVPQGHQRSLRDLAVRAATRGDPPPWLDPAARVSTNGDDDGDPCRYCDTGVADSSVRTRRYGTWSACRPCALAQYAALRGVPREQTDRPEAVHRGRELTSNVAHVRKIPNGHADMA